MIDIKIARTKYQEGYWLIWKTGFNDVRKAFSLEAQEQIKLSNDIQVILEDDKGERLGDAICHYGSYGVHEGLWEIMIDSLPKAHGERVLGYLTWKEVEKYFDKQIRKLAQQSSESTTGEKNDGISYEF